MFCISKIDPDLSVMHHAPNEQHRMLPYPSMHKSRLSEAESVHHMSRKTRPCCSQSLVRQSVSMSEFACSPPVSQSDLPADVWERTCSKSTAKLCRSFRIIH